MWEQIKNTCVALVVLIGTITFSIIAGSASVTQPVPYETPFHRTLVVTNYVTGYVSPSAQFSITNSNADLLRTMERLNAQADRILEQVRQLKEQSKPQFQQGGYITVPDNALRFTNTIMLTPYPERER